jgi:hypothetical protein
MVGLLLENLPRHLDCGHCPRPPGVESQMDDHFGKLSLGQSVLLSSVQVPRKLLRVSVGDERSDRDQAAVSLR